MGSPRIPNGEFGEVYVMPKIVNGVRIGWQARCPYRDPVGRKREVARNRETKGAARRAIEEAKANLRADWAAAGVLTTSTTVAEMLALYLDERRRDPLTKANTVATYAEEARLVVEPMCGGMRVVDATATRLHSAFKRVDKSGRDTRTARIVLRGALQMAVDLGLLATNPMASVKTPRKKRPKRNASNPIALTDEQIEWLREDVAPVRRHVHGPVPNTDLADLVEGMLGTCTRIGEALALRWTDLHLDAEPPLAHICGTMIDARPPEIPQQYRQPYTKSGRDEGDNDRWVILPSEAVAMFKARRKRTKWRRQTDPVFASRTGTHLSAHNMRTRLRRAIEADPRFDGVKVKPHTLRGTYLTRVAETLGLDAAQAAAGHADPSTTRRYYVAKRKIAPDPRAALASLYKQEPPGPESGAESGG